MDDDPSDTEIESEDPLFECDKCHDLVPEDDLHGVSYDSQTGVYDAYLCSACYNDGIPESAYDTIEERDEDE